LYTLTAHSGLTKKKINDYQPIFEQAARTLLKALAQASEQGSKSNIPVCRFMEDYAMLTVLRVAFGDILTMKPGDEELQKVFELTAGAASFLGPKEQLLEFFPILKWIIPQQPAFVKHWRNMIYSFYGPLFRKLDEQLEKGPDDSNDCFFKEVAGKLTDAQRIGFAAVFVGAGKNFRCMQYKLWYNSLLKTF
jgi:cytochrome P450